MLKVTDRGVIPGDSNTRHCATGWGGADMAQEGRAFVWQSEGCQFDPTLGVSKCP